MRSKLLLISLMCFTYILCVTLSFAKEPVKIGVIACLSGPFAATGKIEEYGARMAVEEYGTVLGEKVELIVKDNAFSAGLSVERAKELYEKEKVDAIFCVPHSAGALGVSGQALKNKKLFFANSTAGTDLIANNPYTIKWTFHNYMLATAISAWCAEQLGKTFYTITADYATPRDSLKVILDAMQKKGGSHVGNDFVALRTTDFGPYILKAKRVKPEVVIFLNVSKDTINSVRAAAEYGLKKEAEMIYLYVTGTDIKEAGIDIFSGGYTPVPWYWKVKNPGAQEFADRYHKRFGGRPHFMVAGGYSAIWQYLEAVKRAGTSETIAVLKALRNHTFRDFFANPGYVRAEDNLLIADSLMLKVKKSEDVKEADDFFDVVGTIPAKEVHPNPEYWGRKLEF